ncbi:hypothetical protein KC930_01290 [Candidatus Saccharibacteria bacterium]|nr:hypothetical protein [Candidatus Saccharibacteria bacterium]
MRKYGPTLLFLSALCAMLYLRTPRSYAVSAGDWKPGRIIDDVVFQNKASMTVDQIQQFLDSKVPTCDTYGTKLMWAGGPTRAQWSLDNGKDPAPYTCLKDYVENPTTKANNATDPSIVVPGGLSAAQLIYNAAQAQNINPQVFLVLLQKEQSLVTDDWPYASQFEKATGNNCPDTAPCNPAYAWLWTQVNNAGAQFNYYVNHFDQYNYAPGWNNILYNPNTACGRQSVFIENKYTAALYIYTPYVPNQAALNNMYGTGDGCSAYGNRNFWRMFNDWFGDSIRNLVSSNGGTYLIQNDTKRAFPNEETFFSYSYSWANVLPVTSAELSLIPDGPPMAYNVNFRNGLLVTSKTGGMFIVANGTKRAFPSEAIFLSYGYKYTDALKISDAEISLIPDGTPMAYDTHKRDGLLVTSTGKGMYVVSNGQKRPFPNEVTFMSFGYKFSDALVISNSELSLIPAGTPMPYNVNFRNGKLVSVINLGIFFIENGTKRPFPNEAIFLSYSYNWADVVNISPAEMQLIPDGVPMPANI